MTRSGWFLPPAKGPGCPRLDNPHERNFRQVELALLRLIFGLDLADVPEKREAMIAAAKLVTEFREVVRRVGPGRLSS
jgi:hypothetical protein